MFSRRENGFSLGVCFYFYVRFNTNEIAINTYIELQLFSKSPHRRKPATGAVAGTAPAQVNFKSEDEVRGRDRGCIVEQHDLHIHDPVTGIFDLDQGA
jgi:hypothetical protein